MPALIARTAAWRRSSHRVSRQFKLYIYLNSLALADLYRRLSSGGNPVGSSWNSYTVRVRFSAWFSVLSPNDSRDPQA